jgi:hypothetical protein
VALAAAACSSGGGDEAQPLDCSVAPALPAGQAFTLSGRIEYELVPATYDPRTDRGTLLFAAAERRPVRDATVEIRQCTTVLATATTDASGSYSVTFTPGTPGPLFVVALARTTSPPIQVEDNTAGDAIWAVGQPIDSASPTRDLLATHGWTGLAYGPGRIAAPFAILDAMYTAGRRLLDLPRDVPFPPLRVNWSPANHPSDSYDPATGRIVTSHYSPSSGEIYVLGAAGIDTDEFDREVVVHEWGHYFEANLSRSDSPGGPHGIGSVLDPRIAFGEGYASAFAAALLDEPIYADTYWNGLAIEAFGWNAETAPSPSDASYPDDPYPGPFSEMSVLRALYDVYDTGAGEAHDASAVGLGPIYDTLVGPEKVTPALTTLASFVAGLKSELGADAAAREAVDDVLARYSIGPIATEWGDGDADLRAMFADVAVPSSITATLDGTYAWNEQPQNRFYVFTAGAAGSVTVTSACGYDVDLEAYWNGNLLAHDWSPDGNDAVSFATTPGQVYVVVLTGWGTAGGGAGQVPGDGTYSATLTFASP